MLGTTAHNLRPSSSNVSLNSNTSSTTQSHPLTSPTIPSTSKSFYSSLTPSTSTSSIAILNQNNSNVVRSRKTPQPQSQPSASTSTNSSPGGVDPEVTRPSLQKLNARNTGILKETIGKGKGKSVDRIRQSLDELSGVTSSNGSGEGEVVEAEREVLVHQIQKTDTLASVALQYGITPQALRLSNRLWANDSIHLRKHLHIPLDQCHLPSSSSIERVSRDEDGSLIIWEKSPSLPEAKSPVEQEREQIWSPSARRVVSEMGGVSAWSSTADLLGLGESGRNSLEEEKGKGKANGSDPTSYLQNTNNPYSNSSNPPSPPVRLASPFDFFGRSSPLVGFPHLNQPPPQASSSSPPPNLQNGYSSPPSTSTDDSAWLPPSRPESTDSTFSFSSRASSNLNPNSTRRTLIVEKVKASELKFFPAPSASFSSFDPDKTPTPTSISSFPSQTHSSSSQFREPHIGHGMAARRSSMSVDLGFPDLKPLANTLSRLVPNGNGGKKEKEKEHWSKKWDIFDYGGEEEDAEYGGGVALRGMGLGVGMGVGETTQRKRNGNGNGNADRRSRSQF